GVQASGPGLPDRALRVLTTHTNITVCDSFIAVGRGFDSVSSGHDGEYRAACPNQVCGGQLLDKSPCHSAFAFITNQTVGQMYFQPPDIVRLQNSGGLRRNVVESLRGQRGELPTRSAATARISPPPGRRARWHAPLVTARWKARAVRTGTPPRSASDSPTTWVAAATARSTTPPTEAWNGRPKNSVWRSPTSNPTTVRPTPTRRSVWPTWPRKATTSSSVSATPTRNPWRRSPPSTRTPTSRSSTPRSTRTNSKTSPAWSSPRRKPPSWPVPRRH